MKPKEYPRWRTWEVAFRRNQTQGKSLDNNLCAILKRSKETNHLFEFTWRHRVRTNGFQNTNQRLLKESIYNVISDIIYKTHSLLQVITKIGCPGIQEPATAYLAPLAINPYY